MILYSLSILTISLNIRGRWFITKEQRDANRDALLFILERMDILGDGIDEVRCVQSRPLGELCEKLAL